MFLFYLVLLLPYAIIDIGVLPKRVAVRLSPE